MTKFLVALLTTVTLATPAFAVTGYEFYSNDTTHWHIGGYTGDTDDVAGGLNPACYAEYAFQDGSSFQLIKDLEDGEVYIWLRNMEWNISDTPGAYSLRMNIVNRRGDIGSASGNYEYELVNKNTVMIRGLNVDEFIPAFMNSTEVRLVMPGDIPNAYIPLEGSSVATQMIAECIKSSDEVVLNY